MKTPTIFLVALSMVSSAQAGEISKRTYSKNFEWESTDCYKPSPPMVFDLNDYTVMQIESYLRDVERFRRCVEDEAEADFREADKKLAEAIQDGIEEALSEVDNDISSLETSILLAE